MRTQRIEPDQYSRFNQGFMQTFAPLKEAPVSLCAKAQVSPNSGRLQRARSMLKRSPSTQRQRHRYRPVPNGINDWRSYQVEIVFPEAPLAKSISN